MYKHFKESEVVGLQVELVLMLDQAREKAGIPFVITSGLRTPEHNKEIGGVENSAHLTGKAVDIHCETSEQRFKILGALIEAGFKRIGIGSDFIHADIDADKPWRVIFLENR